MHIFSMHHRTPVSLTHGSPLMHTCFIKLSHHWFRQLLVTCWMAGHHLNQSILSIPSLGTDMNEIWIKNNNFQCVPHTFRIPFSKCLARALLRLLYVKCQQQNGSHFVPVWYIPTTCIKPTVQYELTACVIYDKNIAIGFSFITNKISIIHVIWVP